MQLLDGYHDVPAGKLAAVVTYLEMRAPAPRRPERSDVAWELSPLCTPGAHGISVAERGRELDRYLSIYTRVGAEWLWFSRLAMRRDELSAIVHDRRVEVFALRIDGTDEGLLELDFRDERECELAFFGVSATQVGSGAGRYMMNRAIERAWSKPIDRLWVHTCTLDHPAAVGFYVRSGFSAYRQAVEVADDPRLIGLLPKTAAPQVPRIEGSE